jgi:hypothetical protein
VRFGQRPYRIRTDGRRGTWTFLENNPMQNRIEVFQYRNLCEIGHRVNRDCDPAAACAKSMSYRTRPLLPGGGSRPIRICTSAGTA